MVESEILAPALSIESVMQKPTDTRLNKIAAPIKSEKPASRHRSSPTTMTAIPKNNAVTPLFRDRKTVAEPSVATRTFTPKRSTANQAYESTVESFAVQSFLPKPKTVNHSRATVGIALVFVSAMKTQDAPAAS